MRSISILAAGLCILVAACGSGRRDGFVDDGSESSLDPSIGNPPSNPGEPEACQKMDILFVVDDSGSMAEEQGNLAVNFPKFIDKLNSFVTKGGAALDWRVAVTTTGRDVTFVVTAPFPGAPSLPMSEKGNNGAFRSGCNLPRKWLERNDPDAADRFSCLAQAGTKGSGIEMPLYATELALRDRVQDGTNAGFRRDDALLAIVMLTDEDDCSRRDNNFQVSFADICEGSPNLVPPTEFKGIFDGIAGGEGRWATAVIAGEQNCTSSFGDAVEARRLKEFVASAGKNGTFASICEGDLTGALEKALDTFDAACKALGGIR